MNGGDWALRSKLVELDAKAAESGELLRAVQNVLDEEYANDDNFRIKHPTFQGVQSRESGQHFQHDAAHYRQLWDQARASDAALQARLESDGYVEGMKLCSMSREQLDDAMPKSDEAEQKGVVAVASYDTKVLSGELLNLAQLIQARDTACAGLTASCLGAQQTAVEAITRFVEAGNPIAAGGGGGAGEGGGGGGGEAPNLATGEPSDELTNLLSGITIELAGQKAALAMNIAEQEPLLQRIMAENSAFQAARSADAVTLERERVVQGAENATTAFTEMHTQVSEGLAFYTDLVGRLSQIVQTSEGYACAQSMVRRDFEAEQGTVSQEAADAEMARRLADQLQMGEGAATPAIPAPAYPGPAAAPVYPAAYPDAAATPSAPAFGTAPGTAPAFHVDSSPYQVEWHKYNNFFSIIFTLLILTFNKINMRKCIKFYNLAHSTSEFGCAGAKLCRTRTLMSIFHFSTHRYPSWAVTVHPPRRRPPTARLLPTTRHPRTIRRPPTSRRLPISRHLPTRPPPPAPARVPRVGRRSRVRHRRTTLTRSQSRELPRERRRHIQQHLHHTHPWAAEAAAVARTRQRLAA
mmetsp:Transcript_84058/g.238194  ORF Transcript_84058/g.238194 Transcript_84058/m.238194 type:complete len:581 (+) Transcript_84058:731-2473(+)